MKKTMRFLSMAALALVGAATVGCSSDDSIIDEPQQQEVTKNNVVTLTTTVGFDDAAGTRALTSTGVKTFAVGETMALCYWNTSGNWVKAESNALEAGDIADGSKSATFTFTLTNPTKSGAVVYIYPAAMAMEDGEVNNDALYNNQDGTLAKLASTFDYSFGNGAWDGDNLPSLTLENQLAILAITLKDEAGANDITSSITGLTLSDGTYSYSVTRSAADGPIYVAIRPTEDATITVTATDGTKNYTKTLTSKTYAASNGYSVSWKMMQVATDLSTLTAAYTAQDGDILTGTLGSNVKISIADGASVTLKDVTINGVNNTSYKWAGITCLGDATITLEGTNTVKGFHEYYPGIHVPEGKTLTIQGEGSLNASENGYSAGIGGGDKLSCGNIVINGGTVTATGGDYAAGIGGVEGSCGAITISGGTVTATGGYRGAGIGSGNYGSCGAITISGGTVTATGGGDGAGIGSGETGSFDAITISGGYQNGDCGTITIKSTVTKVTATKGSYAPYSIGAGNSGAGITVTIAAGANVTQK